MGLDSPRHRFGTVEFNTLIGPINWQWPGKPDIPGALDLCIYLWPTLYSNDGSAKDLEQL